MKRRKRWGCLAVILLLTIVAAVFGLHWAWKYYGLPEWPDRREYKTIEERAEKALAFARRHNMNEHYALFVDYGIPSGTPRLFVWDFHQKRLSQAPMSCTGLVVEAQPNILCSVISQETNAHHWGASLSPKNMATRLNAAFG